MAHTMLEVEFQTTIPDVAKVKISNESWHLYEALISIDKKDFDQIINTTFEELRNVGDIITYIIKEVNDG